MAQRRLQKSRVLKHSIVIGGRQTSVALEEPFWTSLREIADEQETTTSALVAKIKANRKVVNLSSALRLFVLEFYQDQLRRGR